MEDEKYCSRCEAVKPAEAFNKNPKVRDGLFTYCRKCSQAYSRQWHTDNREEALERRKLWSADNAAQEAASSRRYRATAEGRARILLRAAHTREKVKGVPKGLRIDVDRWLPVVTDAIAYGPWHREFVQVMDKPAPRGRRGTPMAHSMAPSLSRIDNTDPIYTGNFVVEPWIVNGKGRGQCVGFPWENRELWPKLWLMRITDEPLELTTRFSPIEW
jgi:hypothetical protein